MHIKDCVCVCVQLPSLLYHLKEILGQLYPKPSLLPHPTPAGPPSLTTHGLVCNQAEKQGLKLEADVWDDD